jgi:pimeloyl-ACP methyl ester carboxylesterase
MSEKIDDSLPKYQFEVPEKRDIFKTNSTREKVKRITWDIFSTIIFPIGLTRLAIHEVNKVIARKCVLPALEKNKDQKLVRASYIEREKFLKEDPQHRKQVTIRTADGVDLDAVTITNQTDSKKWIIYFNGQGGNYEKFLDNYKKLSDMTGANVLVFNYRGVMRSKGTLKSTRDLVLDGEAMVRYLKIKYEIPSTDILLHGHSLGGGVATAVASYHPAMHLCNDRSFSSLYEGGLSASVYKKKFFTKRTASLLRPIVRPLAAALGWRFDSVGNFKKVKGYRIVICAPGDDVIDARMASLYKGVQKQTVLSNTTFIMLNDQKKPDTEWHTVNLFENAEQSKAYVQHVKEALQLQ